MLDHAHHNLFAQTVNECQQQKGIGGGCCTVVDTVQNLDIANATMLVLLTGNEQLGIGLQLSAITVGNGIRQIHTAYECGGMTCQQGIIIFLGRPRCLKGVSLFFPARKDQRREANEYQRYDFSHYFCLINTLMGEPVSFQFSRNLFSRKRL